MIKKKQHQTSPTPRQVWAPTKPKKGKKETKSAPRSAIFDVQVTGAEIWQAKFKEFLRATTYDPALGYPVGSTDTVDTRLDNGTAFDGERNPLTAESYDDLHGDDADAEGLGGIGGGGEFSTGEVLE